MNCILVTGGTGFLGSNLVKYLLRTIIFPKVKSILEKDKKDFKELEELKGSNIITNALCILIIDNLQTSDLERSLNYITKDSYEELLIKKHSLVNFLKLDVSKPISFGDIHKKFNFINKINQIYHLACPASPPLYQKDPVHTIMTNFLGTKNYLDLAKDTGATFLLSSTSEVYGDPKEHPQKEEYWGNVNPIGIRSCYDEGKRIAETLTYEYSKQYGVCTKIIRIFNTYGPGMNVNDGRVVTNFIKMALMGEDITIYGDGRQSRSFCYVDDLIEGIYRVMNSENSVTGPINLGNPQEINMIKLAGEIIKLTYSTSGLKFLDLPKDDPSRRCPNIEKATRILGWEPKTSLEDGLKKMIQYISETLKKDKFKLELKKEK